MKKKLVWKDISTRVVLKSVVIGHFAMWAVRQSPHLLPKDIEKGIEELNEHLVSNIETTEEELIETTYTNLEENLRKAISNSNTISSWNIAKKGTGNAFISAYSKPKSDYDFIDLDALVRNIAQSIWLELSYNDGGFE